MHSYKKYRSSSRVIATIPRNSVLLQAPAGSGKTELIIRRYIRILSQIKVLPQEILVLTFTRKTVFEIKKRILEKINDGKFQSESNHLVHAFTRNILNKRQKNYQSHVHQKEILVLTIDSFCLYIINKYLGKKNGVVFSVSNNPEKIYSDVVKKLLLSISEKPPWGVDLERIFFYMGNKFSFLESLLVDLLKNREQWFDTIKSRRKNIAKLKKEINLILEKIIIEIFILSEICTRRKFIKEIISLGDFFGCNCFKSGKQKKLGILKSSHYVKVTNNIIFWKYLLDFLASTPGLYMPKNNQEINFFGKKKIERLLLKKINEKKIGVKNIIKKNYRFNEENFDLKFHFSLFYGKKKLRFISSLVKVLPILISYLEIFFRSKKIFDFISLNILALRILHEKNFKKKCILNIKHILVDEFQDISFSQFSLIEKITLNWNKIPGNSIFLVGDPSQSIYRFRNADVSLFLTIRKTAQISLPLKIIKLRRNFRSCRSIVYWSNKLFKNIFLKKANVQTGSIPYTQSKTIGKNSGEVRWYVKYNDRYDIAESRNVSFLVQKIRKKYPKDSIAIIVRSKKHTRTIVDQLKRDFVPFDFLDDGKLSNNPKVIDTFIILCMIILHSDKTSWLLFLQSSLFGLSFRDLNIVSNFESNNSVYRFLGSGAVPKNLSNDALSRIKTYFPILYKYMAHYKTLSAITIVKAILKDLIFKNVIDSSYKSTSVLTYLKNIQKLDNEASLSVQNLKNALDKLYYNSDEKEKSGVRIMTIHKSKGLEFDHVILPGLHRVVSEKNNKLLNWYKKSDDFNSKNVVLSVFQNRIRENYINRYINLIEEERLVNENKRLLYVAMTRSKKTLSLMVNIKTSNIGKIKPPHKNSFLSMLWNQSLVTIKKTFKKFNFSQFSFQEKNQNLKIRHKKLYLDSKNTILPLEFVKISKNNFPKLEHFHKIEKILHLEFKKIVFITKNPLKERLVSNVSLKEVFSPYFFSIFKKVIRRSLFDPRKQWILHQQHKLQCKVNFYSFSSEKIFWIVKNISFTDLFISRLFFSNEKRNLCSSRKLGLYSAFSSHWVEFTNR